MHLARARHEYLLRELKLRGSVRSTELATTLGVSEVTIRRDVVELARRGLLARVHGGAIALTAEREPAAAHTLVGIVVPHSSQHFAPVVRGAESVAAPRRARLVLASTDHRPSYEEQQVERLLSLGVDGLIIAPTPRGRTEDELAERFSRLSVPCVLIERRFTSSAIQQFDYVRTDHYYGAGLAVEHFAGLGHRAVAIAVFDRTPTAPSVRAGHRAAVERLGLEPAPDVTLPKPTEAPAELAEVIEQLLNSCDETGVRAVLVHTDDHATRLIEAALDRGLRVPDDLAVISYDDEYAQFGAVPISAVAAPRYELGREALRMLLDRIGESREGASRPPRHVELLPRLIVRESSAPRGQQRSR